MRAAPTTSPRARARATSPSFFPPPRAVLKPTAALSRRHAPPSPAACPVSTRRFLDPLDNEEYGGRSGIAIGIDTLVQETNRGSRQWIAGSSELPPSMRALDEWGDDTIDAPVDYLKVRSSGRARPALPRGDKPRSAPRLRGRSAPLGVAMALADAAGAASGVSL